MAGDLFAYGQAYDSLDRIDPRMGRVRDALLGSYDMGFEIGGKSLRQRYDLLDEISGMERSRVGSVRSALRKQRERSLKAGTLPFTSDAGGVGSRKASKREINAFYKAEIERRVKAIRAASRARRKQVMAPVRRFRSGRREAFEDLERRGEFFRDIISQTRGSIAATRTAQATQGRAFFASGGRVGGGFQVPTADGPVQVNVVLADPVLAALNPQIELEVNRLGKRTHSRGRAAGGRRAVL